MKLFNFKFAARLVLGGLEISKTPDLDKLASQGIVFEDRNNQLIFD